MDRLAGRYQARPAPRPANPAGRRVVRKGARKARIPLTPATVAALDAYLADRVRRAGRSDARQLAGPLLATASGGRLRQGHLWELVRCLARDAGIEAWGQLSPHCLRHSAITFALDAGATLRDVQDYAGHKDPRTTRRYDHARDSLDRNAAHAVAAYLAWPEHTPRRPSVARPPRLRPGADPSWASRPEPARAVSASRPAGLADLSGLSDLVARRHGRSGAGSTSSSTGSPARARVSSSAAIAASGDG